jgi:uncharacterized protein (TIGR00661 family)
VGRILYGVMGDSGGHVNRARIVVSEMPEHEFLFVGSGRVRDLEGLGFPVETVPCPGTVYRGSRVSLSATAAGALAALLTAPRVTRRLAEVIRAFNPDLILTDYEFFTPLAARRLGRPCVSLDNQHALTLCDCSAPAEQRMSGVLTRTAIRGLYSHADRYLITFFAKAAPRDAARVRVVPPLVGREVLGLAPTVGEHALVYQTSPQFGRVLPLLRAMRSSARVYGLGERPDEGRIVFRPPSRAGFLRDLASARYVVCNGSHNVICEALCLGKPVLALPIGGAYEQLFNAHFLRALGYGAYAAEGAVSPGVLEAFEDRLTQCRTRIAAAGSFFGNAEVVAALNECMGRAGEAS